MGWLLSVLSGPLVKAFGDTLVQPILQAYLASRNVDLEKFKAADASTTQLAVAILDANVKFATVKSQYALAVLQWWPFRVILFLLLAVCATRFCLVLIDSTWWWIFGCSIAGHHASGDVCSWSIPTIKGTYANVEVEFLLFWIIAKPVDTAVTGGINLVSRYLGK